MNGRSYEKIQNKKKLNFRQGNCNEVVYDEQKPPREDTGNVNGNFRVKCLYKSDSDMWYKTRI